MNKEIQDLDRTYLDLAIDANIDHFLGAELLSPDQRGREGADNED